MSTDPTPDQPCSWCRRPGHTADRLPTGDERAARWRDIALTRPGYATYPDTRPGPQRRVQLPAVSWAHQPAPQPLADIRPARPLLPIGGPDDAVTLPRVGGAVTVVWQRPETGPDLDALARSHAGEGPTKGSTTSDALRGSQAVAPSRRWWDPRTWGRR